MECFYYTSRGIPPYMPHHSLGSLQISFPQFYSQQSLFDTVSFRDYTGLQHSSTYLTVRDIMNERCSIEGSSNPKFVKIGIPTNSQISAKEYMKFAFTVRPEYVVSLAEEAPIGSGKHRGHRSARNAVKLLDDCLQEPRNSKILGNIQGGKDLETRAWCTRQMKKKDVDGFVIGGIQETGKQVRRIVERVMWDLKDEHRPIVLSGPGRPFDIVYAAVQGVTHFEVSWPFTLASQGKALNLSLGPITESRALVDDNYFEQEIDLHKPLYEKEKRSLVGGCECYTCQTHHKGYIHYLLKTKEMNAQTLISIHNVHTYSKLMDCLTLAKEAGTLQNAYYWIVSQYGVMNIN